MSNYIRVNMEISDLIYLIEKYNEDCRKLVDEKNEATINLMLSYWEMSLKEKFHYRMWWAKPGKTREECIAIAKKDGTWCRYSDSYHYTATLPNLEKMLSQCLRNGVTRVDVTDKLSFLFGEYCD